MNTEATNTLFSNNMNMFNISLDAISLWGYRCFEHVQLIFERNGICTTTTQPS
jgi:hypothetical protein